MARDVLSVLDSLEWPKAHIVGHSMGGMIAAKLATIDASRVASLSLISTSQGGWDSVPALANLR